MTLHPTATRIWKHLSPDARLQAANAFLAETPRELAGSALAVLAKARNLRPQTARKLPSDAQARILGSVLDPGEPLAQGLLVSLHLAGRRPLLSAFLDALGMAHENGVLKEETESESQPEPQPLPSSEKIREGVLALGAFPRDEVLTYLNTLLLQDPERWAALEHAEEWLGPQAGTA